MKTQYDYSQKHELQDFVGKQVMSTFVHVDHDVMFWKVDGEWYCIHAQHECCDHSWFEHCDNADAFANAQITSFEEVDMEGFVEEDHDEHSGCIRINMLKFATTRGYCTIEFRNSSNGYYSGYVDISKVVGEPDLTDYVPLTDY